MRGSKYDKFGKCANIFKRIYFKSSERRKSFNSRGRKIFPIIVKNLIFDTYFMKHFAFLACFVVLDFIHRRERKGRKDKFKMFSF
jgi:hypothetical protein